MNHGDVAFHQPFQPSMPLPKLCLPLRPWRLGVEPNASPCLSSTIDNLPSPISNRSQRLAITHRPKATIRLPITNLRLIASLSTTADSRIAMSTLPLSIIATVETSPALIAR
jgi:hypothetical protein